MYEWYQYACYVCMNVYVWDSYDSITVRLLRRTWAGAKSGPTSQYKYLVTLNGDNITGEDTNIVGMKPFNQNAVGV